MEHHFCFLPEFKKTKIATESQSNQRQSDAFVSSLASGSLRTSSFQGIGAVQGVALGGDETGVGDDAAEFGFVGAVADAGGVHHVFFDEDAANVVGAELQANLADLDAGSEPAGLNVVNVVEIEAADGQRFQVIHGGGFLNFFAERRIV